MSSKKDKKAAKKAKLEEDQPEVDQPGTPGPSLDRKLEFPANNSNDDNTSEDNSSIGSDPIGAADPHKKKRNRKSKKVVVQQATYQMKELGGLVF
jgi:hypothetical protein